MKGAKFMVADFSKKTVDMNNVAKNVQDFVANVAKLEGKKKKIDTENEFYQLSAHLANFGQTLNVDERNYIEGFMIEYQQERAKQFEENAVTKNTKKEVDNIKKRMGNKKEIDSDEEAQALVMLMRNSRGKLNQADLIYIQNLLIKSGYAHYLQPTIPPVNVVNITIVEEKAADKEDGEPNVQNTNGEANTVEKPIKQHKKGVYRPKGKAKVDNGGIAKKEADRAKSEADRSSREADRSAREADRSKAEADRAKKEADRIASKPKVSEAARAEGFGIANKIQEELHDIWTDNDKIKAGFDRVNEKNVFSFVGKMLEVTDSHSVFGDSRKRIDAKQFRHVAACLLNQANSIGLGNSNEYKALKAEVANLDRDIKKFGTSEYEVDSYDSKLFDEAVTNLYKKMCTVYK